MTRYKTQIRRRVGLTTALAVAGVLIASTVSLAAGTWTTPTVNSYVSVGDVPRYPAITPDGSQVWIPNSVSDSVTVVSTATNSVVGTVTGIEDPYFIVFSPDGSTAYVSSDSGAVSLTGVNTTTLATTSYDLGGGVDLFGMAISPDGSYLYLADHGTTDRLLTVATATLSSPTTTPTGSVAVGTNPVGVAVSPDGSTVYVANLGSNSVSVVDVTTPATPQIDATISGMNVPFIVDVSPDGATAYVANSGNDTVGVIDTATNAVTGSIAVGDGPVGLAISADGAALMTANSGANSVSVVDLASNTVTGTASMGAGTTPRGVAFSLDGTLGYVTLEASDQLAIMSTGYTPPEASGPNVPRAPMQQFGVAPETPATDCLTMAAEFTDGSALDWEALTALRENGWGLSYAFWPNEGQGGWVCTRQPYYVGPGWNVR